MATHFSTLAWKISTGRGAWWAIVHGVAKESDMTEQLNNKYIHTHTHTHTCIYMQIHTHIYMCVHLTYICIYMISIPLLVHGDANLISETAYELSFFTLCNLLSLCIV